MKRSKLNKFGSPLCLGTGEQIYQSKAIPVGSKIERAALDVELPAGTYECTAMFHNLDPVSGEIIGTAGAIITITVKNHNTTTNFINL